MSKVILSCAVTRASQIPSMSPYLPITPHGIAREAISVAEVGAGSVHLHAQNPTTGEPPKRPIRRALP
jgi:uncharacterized protein (DUF849 family)